MSGLWKPLVAGPARHLANLIRDPEYRQFAWLESTLGGRPRREPFRLNVHGWSLEVPDAASFLSTYREIFHEHQFDFPWQGSPPSVLDLGANIGLSVLYFHRLHPGSRIVAVEADPALFAVLERNLKANAVRDVELIQKAAWIEDGRVEFLGDGADGGQIVSGSGGPASGAARATESVEALNLPRLLAERKFDFIKMDIEGAERLVLPACAEGLRHARFVAVEYHSPATGPQSLGAILATLEGCGFRVHVHTAFTSPRPLVERRTHSGFDLQLNLFAWRA